MTSNEMTAIAQRESAWPARARMRFPKGVEFGTRTILDLLRGRLIPRVRFIEIGCARGKSLAWVSRTTRRSVARVDYCPTEVEPSPGPTNGVDIQADARCKDACDTSFAPASCDWGFSYGLVEHFEDPTTILGALVRLVALGDLSVITIQSCQGMYRRVQVWRRPQSLAALWRLTPRAPDIAVTGFACGRFSPWITSLPPRLGRSGTAHSWALNFATSLRSFHGHDIGPVLVFDIGIPISGACLAED